MALLWADGFDHHGTDKNNLPLDGYSNVPNGGVTLDVSGNYARTGLGALRVTATNFNYLRRLISIPQYIIGFGCGLRHASAPSAGAYASGFRFEDTGLNTIVHVGVGMNLEIFIRTAAGATIAQTPNNTIKLGAYHQLEVAFGSTCGSDWHPNPIVTTGQMEIRLDKVPVFYGTDMPVGSLSKVNGWSVGHPGSSGGGASDYAIDDLVIWDTTGADNNWFMGERRCRTIIPESVDAAMMDWLPSAGAPDDAIDELIPDYSDLITAGNNGDRIQFYMSQLGILTNSVAGVRIHTKARRTDAGASSFQIGMNSNGTVLNSPPIPVTTSWAGYSYLFERNPSGLLPWDKTSLEAALVRLTRSA